MRPSTRTALLSPSRIPDPQMNVGDENGNIKTDTTKIQMIGEYFEKPIFQ
jgi:hypothetical protein